MFDGSKLNMLKVFQSLCLCFLLIFEASAEDCTVFDSYRVRSGTQSTDFISAFDKYFGEPGDEPLVYFLMPTVQRLTVKKSDLTKDRRSVIAKETVANSENPENNQGPPILSSAFSESRLIRAHVYLGETIQDLTDRVTHFRKAEGILSRKLFSLQELSKVPANSTSPLLRSQVLMLSCMKPVLAETTILAAKALVEWENSLDPDENEAKVFKEALEGSGDSANADNHLEPDTEIELPLDDGLDVNIEPSEKFSAEEEKQLADQKKRDEERQRQQLAEEKRQIQEEKERLSKEREAIERDKKRIADLERREEQKREEFKRRQAKEREERKQRESLRQASSGTGFAVSKDGFIVTNQHVIDSCQGVQITSTSQTFSAEVVAFDLPNDLAVLKANFSPSHVFPVRRRGPILSEDIYVAGFPFGYGLSTSLKVTKGVVSSLSGIGNNFSNIQIDAALQPGNSGGPILDEKGNVVGVAVAKLDRKETEKIFGAVPENINFGIKANVVISILQSIGVEIVPEETLVIDKVRFGDALSDGTYYISCWMTAERIEEVRKRKVLFEDFSN